VDPEWRDVLMMKRSLAACLMTFLAHSPAAVANICINVQDIMQSTPNKDGTAITFKMRDGKVWQNHLQTPCPDLRFDGFSWFLPVGTQVCSRQQSIRVLRSPEVCTLGDFTEVTPAKH
jgi:hypothetical protein